MSALDSKKLNYEEKECFVPDLEDLAKGRKLKI
jgi:hypothetical protein